MDKSVTRTWLIGEVSRFPRKDGWVDGLLGTSPLTPPPTLGRRTFLRGLLVLPGAWEPGLPRSPAHLE